MLQTRLKEAEVAVAARDPSVRIVDAAILPKRPVAQTGAERDGRAAVRVPARSGGGAFTREYMNRAIRSRMDVRGSTGLQVIRADSRASPGRPAGSADLRTGKRKLLQDAPPAPRVRLPNTAITPFSVRPTSLRRRPQLK